MILYPGNSKHKDEHTTQSSIMGKRIQESGMVIRGEDKIVKFCIRQLMKVFIYVVKVKNMWMKKRRQIQELLTQS